MEKFGIKNLKILIVLPVELGNIADKIGHDGSNKWSKWLLLVDAVDEIFDVARIDWDALKKELQDLSPEEIRELAKTMKEKLDITNKLQEELVHESIDMLLGLIEIFRRAINLSRTVKQA